MKAVCTTLGCWAAAAAPIAWPGVAWLFEFPASGEPLEAVMLFAPVRSLSGVLWTGRTAPVVAADGGGVTSIGSLVDGPDDKTDDERTGSLRVLPGASVAPEATVFLVGRSARLCISRGGTGVMGDDGRTPQAGEGNLGQDGVLNFFFLDPKAAEKEVKMRRS